jgi:hypothetical protein
MFAEENSEFFNSKKPFSENFFNVDGKGIINSFVIVSYYLLSSLSDIF